MCEWKSKVAWSMFCWRRSPVDVDQGIGWKLMPLSMPIGIYMKGVETMMIYRTKYHAMEAAMSDEVAVRVEAGWMLIPRKHYKRWKRR